MLTRSVPFASPEFALLCRVVRLWICIGEDGGLGPGLGYQGNPAHVRPLLEVNWITKTLLKEVLRGLTRLLPFSLHTPPNIHVNKRVCVRLWIRDVRWLI